MYTGIRISEGGKSVLIPMERILDDFVLYEAGRESGDYQHNAEAWYRELRRNFEAREDWVMDVAWDNRQDYAREFLGVDTDDVEMDWAQVEG